MAVPIWPGPYRAGWAKYGKKTTKGKRLANAIKANLSFFLIKCKMKIGATRIGVIFMHKLNP